MTPTPTYLIHNSILVSFSQRKTNATCVNHLKTRLTKKKKKLQCQYKSHQEEKELSRTEKASDKEKAKEDGSNTVLVMYDLQAVLPVPMGQTSAFYYKSRLNCFNFTISEIGNDKTSCYFWHEGLGHRGAVEIGSCVLSFLEEIANTHPQSDIILYSDNCGGQQKKQICPCNVLLRN
ncbi:unnamed protein product [Diabrotica balteata]|uniref:Uncharacterized protein n=1 Tax=Diabrotica balteata TaxID=107213 RepID=A0A9N9T0Y9_DIABA|nr:unnamed protein product [Diabrotica balteata]